MWIADSLAALVMGALSGMGVGGGGLLVIYLTLIKGMGQIEAQGLNLYFFLFASAASLFIHTAKRRINYPLVLFLASLGIPAAFLGSLAASRADPHTVRLVFGIMLMIAGALSLLKSMPHFFHFKKEGKK